MRRGERTRAREEEVQGKNVHADKLLRALGGEGRGSCPHITGTQARGSHLKWEERVPSHTKNGLREQTS